MINFTYGAFGQLPLFFGGPTLVLNWSVAPASKGVGVCATLGVSPTVSGALGVTPRVSATLGAEPTVRANLATEAC